MAPRAVIDVPESRRGQPFSQHYIGGSGVVNAVAETTVNGGNYGNPRDFPGGLRLAENINAELAPLGFPDSAPAFIKGQTILIG